MRTVTCDACGENVNGGTCSADFPIHLVEAARGHVNGYVDGNGNAVSGRTVHFDFCNSCFNLSLGKAVDAVKSIQSISDFEPTDKTKLI